MKCLGKKIGRKYAKILTLMIPRCLDYVFFLLVLYSVWYFPCSVKMHVNYISKKRKQKSLCFPKNFMVIIFHRHSTKKGTIFQINTMSN